jgi:hypothetical protein
MNRAQREVLFWGIRIVGLIALLTYLGPPQSAAQLRSPYVTLYMGVLLIVALGMLAVRRGGVTHWRPMTRRQRSALILDGAATAAIAWDTVYGHVMGLGPYDFPLPAQVVGLSSFAFIGLAEFIRAGDLDYADSESERQSFAVTCGVMGVAFGAFSVLGLVVGLLTGPTFFTSRNGLVFWIPASMAATLIVYSRHLRGPTPPQRR